MRFNNCLAGLLLIAAFATADAQDAVKNVFQTDVGDVTDQEILVLEVNYPPGNDSPVHRHNAHTIVYVLEGTVVMQVKGSEPQTLGPGEVFYETPEDVHTVSRNASDTESAKILVFFLKGRGAATTESTN
jgi:quercetin dioxygenase-like cupin family protein